MRNSLIILLGAISLGAIATPAAAQNISGGVDLKSSYVLSDFLYEAGPDPVVQGYANVAIGDSGCNAGVWGNVSTGEQVGTEIDLSAGCEFNVAPHTTVTVTAARYLLLDGGVPDMTAVTVEAKHGPFDAKVGVYIWDGGLADGAAAEVGYTAEVERFSIRGSLHWATGLGDDDIVFVGGEVSRPITSHLTASVSGYVPIVQSRSDAREGRIVAALSWSF